MHRTLVLALSVGFLGCSGTMTAPSSLMPPTLVAVPTPLIVGDDLTPKGWAYQGEARNTGRGCATQVHGTIEFRHESMTPQTSIWTLEPTRVVRPSETFTYAGCCIEPRFGNLTLAYSVTFDWQTVAC
jgi:hypothetical protein